jgi:hypothetical protein
MNANREAGFEVLVVLNRLVISAPDARREGKLVIAYASEVVGVAKCIRV